MSKLKTLCGCTSADPEQFAMLADGCKELVQSMANQAFLNSTVSFTVDRHASEIIANRESYPEVLITFRLCAIGTKTKTTQETR
jgi:hypothetical protein